jgi:hypothetical protein
MISIGMAALALAGAAPAQTLPTHYEAGHFYATPQTVDGSSLRLLVDTGGGGAAGMYWLSAKASQRLGLKTGTCTVDGDALPVATPPAYRPGRQLPPAGGPCAGKLLVNPGPYPDDGQLGAAYLGNRVWTFDYPRQQLRMEATDWRPDPTAHRAPLGFQTDAHGKVAQHFPRIVVHIDGKPLDMLLDTGATAHPTPAGKAAAGTETVNGFGAASYITTSMLESWHKAHPRWPIVEDGDDLMAPRLKARLIEVPKMEIAGWSVGPVWFTERPDRAFHGMMARLMDTSPEGAIGANVLVRFRLTIDYPQAIAWFSCAGSCTAAAPDRSK